MLLVDAKAVLGSVPRLVLPRGNCVIWAPADDECLAGEIFADTYGGATWAIKGRIVELRRAEQAAVILEDQNTRRPGETTECGQR
jgi:hypothetical protein